MSVQFYNEAFLSYPPYEEAPMRFMYEKAASLINKTTPVVDLGCGSGYMASALKDKGYTGQYVGYDLSPVAVEIARSALSDLQTTLFPVPPQYEFHVRNLLKPWPEDRLSHKNVYTCFEVLEHINQDLLILHKLPARSRFIFSVPNYWSETHVRTYDSVGTAMDRYGHLLNFKSWWIMPTKQEGAAIHLYDTLKRPDVY